MAHALRLARLTLVVMIALSVAACDAGDQEASAPPSSLEQETHFANGDPRQRPEFEQVAAQLQAGIAEFFGEAHLEQTRADRDRPGTDQGKRLNLTISLVFHLLRHGQTEEAIREVDALFAQLEQMPGVLDTQPQVHRLRGLTYLRLAEVENCINRHNADCCLLPLRGGGVHTEKQPALEAQRSYERYLALEPDDLAVRWLLNIASMAAGDYPDGVPAAQRIPLSAFDSDYEIKRFPDIAVKLGVNTLNLAGGVIADDFDGDGLLDIVTSTIDPLGPLTHYRNVGDGTFEDRSTPSHLDDQLGGLNTVGGDYDGDGDVDVLVLRGAWLFDQGRIRNSLLRNNGDGTFTDVTRAAGVAEPAAPSQAAAWLDYDNDGDLDLYVVNESRADTSMFPPEEAAAGDYPAQLFRNDGDGTFTETAAGAGATNDRYAKGVAVGDYDNDGWSDIYVSNIGRNRLYRNNGDGTFTDTAEAAQVTEPANRSFATWFFDYNNDGWLDLFAAAYDATMTDIALDFLGGRHNASRPRLYHNNGDGTFTDVSRAVGLDRPFLPMGANFGDLDGDGYLDIYLTTGQPSYESIMPNVMLRNDGGRRFQDVSTSGGFGHLQKGHGVAFADFDNDGDQDLYHQLGGFFQGDRFHNALFENPGFGHRFLAIRLVGTTSNRSAYGTRMAVEVDTPAGPRTIHRAVGSVSSFGGSPARQEIGLGDATAIRALNVRWPTGTVSRWLDVPLDTFIEITEGTPEIRTLTLPRLSF